METAAYDFLLCRDIANAMRGTMLETALLGLGLPNSECARITGTLSLLGLVGHDGQLTRSGRRVRLFLTPVLSVPVNLVRHVLELAEPYRARDHGDCHYNRAIDEAAAWLAASHIVPGREGETLAAWRLLHRLLNDTP